MEGLDKSWTEAAATAQIHKGSVVSKKCLEWVDFIRLKISCGSLPNTSRSFVFAVDLLAYWTCLGKSLGQAHAPFRVVCNGMDCTVPAGRELVQRQACSKIQRSRNPSVFNGTRKTGSKTGRSLLIKAYPLPGPLIMKTFSGTLREAAETYWS